MGPNSHLKLIKYSTFFLSLYKIFIFRIKLFNLKKILNKLKNGNCIIILFIKYSVLLLIQIKKGKFIFKWKSRIPI